MTAIASLPPTTASPPPLSLGAGTATPAPFPDLLPPATDAAVPAGRQGDADGGKALPQDDADDDDVLAWLGIPPLTSLTVPAPVPAPDLPVRGATATGRSAPAPYISTGPVSAAEGAAAAAMPGIAREDEVVAAGTTSGFALRSPIAPIVAPVAPALLDRAAAEGLRARAIDRDPSYPVAAGMPDTGRAGASGRLPVLPPLTTSPAPTPLPAASGEVRSPALAADAVPPAASASASMAGGAGASGSAVAVRVITADARAGSSGKVGVATPSDPGTAAVSRPAGAPGPGRAIVAPASAPDAAAPPTIAATAARVFAAAIHRALGDGEQRSPTDPAPSLTVVPLPTGVAAAAAAQGGTLDLRQEHWPQAMVERIAILRDLAAENDTRLRLSPDMLGTIDVSLARDGDAVQVRIAAEQPQTRQLLAEAQPRLAELAEARGVKLHLTGAQPGAQAGAQTGTQFGGAGTGGDAPRQHAAIPTTPMAPQRRHDGSRDDAEPTDQRIA